MKRIFIFAVVAVFLGLIAWNLPGGETVRAQTKKLTNTNKKTPVLVELFTSEGCSDCPPADRVLSKLEKEQPNTDAEIITLSMHVDYWNNLGWKDPFSSAAYSQRQNGYAERFKLDSIYTPQMIVDGQTEFVGSNLARAQKAIGDAAQNTKTNIELSTEDGDKLKIKFSDLPAHENSYVWLAIAEDNLQTNVKRGENGGRTLDHTSVVRDMKLVGNVASNVKNFETDAPFQLQSNWKKENLKFVVFVQGENTKKIFGVNKLDYQ